MINFQTLPSQQLSSSKAEMAHSTDHCQEEIVMCNADSGGSSTTQALIAQGMYSLFNHFCRVLPFFYTLLFMCHRNVNAKN